MHFVLILGLMVSYTTQQESSPNRCDAPSRVILSTPCTSCAASPSVMCPRGSRKTTTGIGTADCSYTVDLAGRTLLLPGCRHTCEQVVTEHRCCPYFWGPLCLPCPSWNGKTCNWHGTCGDGKEGNGTCICEEGFTGFACQECKNKNAYGEQCNSECSCVNGECNNGPSGDGQCYCQPPYSGPKCDHETPSCANCTAYSYCKGEGDQASCLCLPGFRKIGRICSGICSPNTCDLNADCSYKGARNFQCKCKEGYEGDGKVCIPVNPCSRNNGDCPVNSTVCVYVSPGKSRCECKRGMESSPSSAGCTLKSACTENTCDRSAQCETDPDGQPRCTCDAQRISDGRRCYGDIMERILELDRNGNQKGKLTGSIPLFEKGCQLTLTRHGPFTALVPLLKVPLTGISERFLCKLHLILGQHLYKDLEGNDFWTLSGEAVRFKSNKQFIFMKEPYTSYEIIQSDIAAANGIIHIIDMPVTNIHHDKSDIEQLANKTIGEILARNPKYNRFVSLVDNCGTPMPLRGPGPLTVFVPTNNAVDRFRDGSVIYMLTDAKHKLRELLRHHMFSTAVVTVDQIASMSEIQTMANQVIEVNVTNDGRILLGEKGIPLETTDIVASNGIIHLIDGVLVPPSIIPILPHRCDVVESKIVVGPCVRCSYLYQTQCPPGSTELDSHLRDCEYQSPLSSVMSNKGCAKYCNTTRTRAECCKGFYGPDCKPCLGGFQNPCYDKGTCMDGIQGNGTCRCNPGFEGVACHICSDGTKHGENCDEDCHCIHGVCDNRPGSMGMCRRGTCQEGYSGELCDKTATPCDSDGAYETCHIHAYCSYVEHRTTCVCMSGYEGDGHSCTPFNPCLKPDRGGCDPNAQCEYAGPGNASCVCNEGWTGDGLVCAEINNCLLESRGGCHKDADCKFIGPGQNECMCKTGYMGDGEICDIVNPCLSNNGGCHEMATCRLQEQGTHVCICPVGYGGDGTTCYGTILEELDGNSDFYWFNRLIQDLWSLNLNGNMTALIPSKDAYNNLNQTEKEFWTDSYMIPYLIKVHFLDDVWTSEDLKENVNQKVSTLHAPTKWEIKNISGEVMIQNANILIPDIPAVNGYIHVIDKVLIPPLSDVPPLPPKLMDFLNHTPTFSLFRRAAQLYNLTDSIKSRKYTLLIPYDEAIGEHLSRTNSTELDQDLFKYHVILNSQLFPENLVNGLFRSTLLGSSYQIMFHSDIHNKTLANEVLLNEKYNETRNGVVIGIPQVLEIHKNRCNKEVVLNVKGRCGPCDSYPRCPFNSKPVKNEFPPSIKSNCKYRKRVGNKRKRSVPGCSMDCLRKTKDHSCCPGYFGHECFKCPGKVDNWCSNNGKCQDGVHGSGECLCNEGFRGTACEDCEPGRYGKDCKSVCNCSNGKCLDGLNGNGKCVCHKGWKGETCSEEIILDACNGTCDINANCIKGTSGATPTCSCVAGFQGNGTFCKEINPCDSDNGHCSEFANCTKTLPGERTCTCHEGYTGDGVVCLEIDGCSVDNGGCHRNAECMKTGPNLVACLCMTGYSGNGRVCFPVNPCRTNNGDCHVNARCEYLGPGERNCSCRYNFIGDGITCRGTVNHEIGRHPDAFWFFRALLRSRVNDLLGKGPFTVFVPQSNNFMLEPWVNTSSVGDLLRYHMVGCEKLQESDLKSIGKVVAVSGHALRFTDREGVLYINEDAKIITSDYVTSNGILHFIDRVLVPYDLANKTKFGSSELNVTAAAEAYGYTVFSKLLQAANLMSMVQDSRHHPFTMLWPTDEVFNSLPEERKRWLYSEDHQDKLAAYLKGHIIRDTKLLAINLPNEQPIRTMHGSTYSFTCDKKNIGDILVDDGNAKIVDRHLVFDVGIAHGIDQLLEPPNVGARCDSFEDVTSNGRCGSCISPPLCPFGYRSTGGTSVCRRMNTPYNFAFGRFHHLSDRLWPYNSHSYGRYGSRSMGCQRKCARMQWVQRCCKNHFGRDCQVCPGGLEAPCSNHGECVDGTQGTGKCECKAGFKGTACELCESNHYGPNCTVCGCTQNGRCEDGLEGDGSCFCQEGWTGDRCESKMEVKPVCTPECHPNAVCKPGNICECESLYEGDGWNCTAPDLCSDENGGCHQHATCTQTGVNVTCTCLSGYTGDGYYCSPIDRCVQEPNGGCSDFATCVYTGPDQRRCECHDGYVGNGIQCLEKVIPPVDRCLEDNGGCDPKANCKDLHFHENTAGVFHLRSPLGKYKLNYTDAQAACQDEGSSLATFSQLSDAQQLGMHLCAAGWMDEAKVGYPIRFPSAKCGDNHVGIVMYKSPVDNSSTYDAYCYRMKDVSCKCGSEYVGNGEYCNGNLVTVIATNSNFSLFYMTLLNYANSSAQGVNLMNFLLRRSTYVTLFVPENTGFYENETLSLRDMEYHISTNNSIHYYEDLEHGAVIPSHLGHNISVTVSSANTTQLADSSHNKLVNQRLIIDWNIPATNGIIHIIRGPLKAPPLPVDSASSSAHTQSDTAAVTSVLITFLIIGIIVGLAYYFLKHRNDAFRFQYFKNEDDEGTPTRREGNPALVSIPNPLYSGYSAFAEPFSDSPETDQLDAHHILD